MKIRLIDIDSKIPNLALMKLSAWHKQKGDLVGFDIQEPDQVYVSVIFKENRDQAAGLTKMYPNSIVHFGGSGWNLKNFLPDTIERIKPDYDLYPSRYSQGFSTRGCIRKCPFCIVPKKEGIIKIAQHPREFHDDRFRLCMLMDNNFLASGSEWIHEVLNWFHETGTAVDMPQGFDARLLTEEWAGMLKDIKHPKGVRFAWDNMQDEAAVIKAIDLLKNAGFDLKHYVSFYVLAGFNTTFEQDLYRCNKLRDLGVNSFVMQYHKKDPLLRILAHNCNQRTEYWKMKPLTQRQIKYSEKPIDLKQKTIEGI